MRRPSRRPRTSTANTRPAAPVTGPAIFSNYVVSDYYWTSTTDAADPTQAWTVYSCDFGVYNIPKSDLRYSLAVR